jgi:hypothetical protein
VQAPSKEIPAIRNCPLNVKKMDAEEERLKLRLISVKNLNLQLQVSKLELKTSSVTTDHVATKLLCNMDKI